MAKPKNYGELIRPFVREFGSALSGLTPSQMDEIATLIQKGDIAGARQRMSYIAAAGRGAEYVPRGTKRYSPAKDAPGGELSIREARPAREFPASTQSPPKAGQGESAADAANDSGGGFFRKVLTPISMSVERKGWFPGDFRPDDTAGDAIRKILGYGVVPGGAVGLAARQLAEGGAVPAGVSEPTPATAEGERQAAVRSSLEAQRERHFQEIMAERFRRNPGMASPRE